MSDPVDVLRRFHDAVNAQDYEVIEGFFADDAIYGSVKVGALAGKAAILAAFRKYFAEYPDQVAHDDNFEKLSEASAKSRWHLEATSATTGERLIRRGEETIFLNADGKIERVDVRDI
ncbi:nuclear transport factor 2 family protein [Mesorhizobium sp. IMUNJ 23232]|uniref:nuclear transport factor 2 family protein n=1 Tax=Mesorhizobium sp. IMUNJ 23232 TaxID=3376064 RepID=UPI0037992402